MNYEILIHPAHLKSHYIYFGKYQFNPYFKKSQKVKIIDEDGAEYIRLTHTRDPRIGGLTDWYRKYNIEIWDIILVEIRKVDIDFVIYLKTATPHLSQIKDEIVEIFPDEIGEIKETTLIEGSKKVVTVNRFERNKEARSKCIKYYGFNCSVCNFNFSDRYGKIGLGFIHVHHLNPISEMYSEYEIDPINDLRPVCPNCHAMLHKFNPPMSIEELKERISLQ